VNKLERLRQERQQVTTLLNNARLLPETRKILTDLQSDLDHEIDHELTEFLMHGGQEFAAD
jgi:hypothetical protein